MKSIGSKWAEKKWLKNDPFENLPYTLYRNKIYVFPTRQGFLFLFVLFIMLIGSVNYNNNLGFLLTFLLGGMVFISIFYTYKNLYGMQVMSVKTNPVFAKDDAIFEYRIRVNDKIRFAIEFGYSMNKTILKDIAPLTENQIKVKKPTEKRGLFYPGNLLILTQFPFGLFFAWTWINIDCNCLVYPFPVSGPFNPSPYPSSEQEGKKEGQGNDDFYGLKPYQPGDSLQRISWKAFSKGQGMFTKTFTAQLGESVMIDFDILAKDNLDLEHKLSRLCDMILKAHRLNIGYGLKIPKSIILPDKSESHKQNCLKALALFGINNEL